MSMTANDPVNKPVGTGEQALLQQANRLLWEGDWPGAARLLGKAAELAQAEGRGVDAARGRQMAAELFRFAGDTEAALAGADALLATPGADPLRLAFTSAAERAEALASAGDDGAAVPAYRQALAHAQALNIPPAWRATVLRRLAQALARSGQPREGRDAYAQARALHAAEGDAGGSALIDIECAETLVATHAWPFVPDAVARVGHVLEALDDAGLEARSALLRARLAQHGGDLTRALAAAETARTQSLAAVAPVSYFAAAALLAQLHDAAGERVAAYGVLATAWATLGDLLGADVAASWVRPLLLAFSLQWGDAAFADAKARHDAQRRARRAGEGGMG